VTSTVWRAVGAQYSFAEVSASRIYGGQGDRHRQANMSIVLPDFKYD